MIILQRSHTVERSKPPPLFPAELRSSPHYRFTEIYYSTLDLLGVCKDMVYQWPTAPAVSLGGELPINPTRTITSSNDVLSLISKVEHGALI